jgi:3-oxoacyl-[acyl-carrier protein] reductase
MNLHFGHRLALVTASTGGIGREIATTLTREGAALRVDGGLVRSVF